MAKVIVFLSFVLFMILGFPFESRGQAPARLIPVVAGDIGVGGDAPFYVGLEKGFYREAGIDLKLQRFRSLGDMTVLLSGGKLHVGRGGVNVALFNSFVRGWPVFVASGGTTNIRGQSPDTVVVRWDLKDEIKESKDLKGRKVAVNAPASPLVFVLGRLLESGGMTLKDVEMVTLGFGDMAVALRNKAIDVALTVEPFPARHVARQEAVIWKRAADFITNPYMMVSVSLFSKEWATANPEAARNFMVGFLKSVRYWYEAVNKGKNRDEVIDIMMKHTAVKERELYDKMHLSYIDPNLSFSKESLKDQQEWYIRNKMMTERADIDKMHEPAYLNYALEKLGRYQVP